ncbi:hypothetical protein EOPP23_12200 [Endozoicomonas sp. OPT23]|uniref:type VI secretion system Vgr family protein n=1 Tax=Endozoicomonas sp. OPT23 TaxID=2072845 RepID=UPI00129BCA9C|nr:type VI secretion system tip protein TssI/VgrG [Endozoicomonas sp. OPT23]MRI33749.1 hypothetical protein [Endozoicomonas sp. OPT23]
MDTIDPRERPLIAKPEGSDELIATELHSRESLGAPFEHRAIVLGRNLDHSAFLGKGISFCYQPTQASSRVRERFFHGFCIQLRELGQQQYYDYDMYEVISQPWTWFLDQRINCRIFQQQTTSDIVRAICKEHSFHSQLDIKASGGSKREYSVQFNESDWHYLCRLIAEEGWFWFFQQDSDQHTLVIADNNRAFQDSGETDVEFVTDSNKLDRALTEWIHDYQIPPASVSMVDYNYELAKSVQADKAKSTSSLNRQKSLSHYYYPGKFADQNAGKTRTSSRMSCLDTRFSQVSGQGALARFSAGSCFKLDHHPNRSEQQKYFLKEVQHTLLTGEDGRSLEYQNQFICLPDSVNWQSDTPMAKPSILGLQSATVTGPDNEELYTDEFHRIKLQFHWDQEGESNEDSSCWVRVAQPVTGNSFGCQFTPRIGDEVLVSFLDGDPDRPLVVGSVYNGSQAQPYEVPTQQGLKLQSTPQAGSDNFSELRFHCKKDEELLYLQAEKDLQALIKNDRLETVQGKAELTIEKTSERTVKEDDSHKIEGAQTTEVSKDVQLKTDGNHQLEIAGDSSQKTDGNYELKVQGKTSAESTGDLALKSQGNIKAEAANSMSLDATSIKGSGKSSVELSVGASKISLSASSIEMSCATSSIKLSASGVEISGMQVKVDGKITAEVKGGVSAALEGSVKTDVKGTMVTINGNAMTSVKAGAMVEIQGAIAKIN